MEWIQNIILALIGFAGGFSVAGGLFAFISILGIIPRIADCLGVASHIYQVETVIAIGGLTGCLISLFQIHLGIGVAGLVIIGLFSGIFVGALAMALAETLKVIPVLCQRADIRQGISIIVTALAVGKMLGSFYQLYFLQ